MSKRILTATIFTVFALGLIFMPFHIAQVQAADKLGWVGPVYKELSASLTKGFKEYYKKTYGKDVDITFVRPGGWPVCLDKVRAWGGKPDADIFLGAGAPAHEVLKAEGLIVPYRPKDWDKVPAEWVDLFCALDRYQSLQRESVEQAAAAAAQNMERSAQSHLPGQRRPHPAICLRHHA
jgi:ABC-type thiamine transport system substrate-binding protein